MSVHFKCRTTTWLWSIHVRLELHPDEHNLVWEHVACGCALGAEGTCAAVMHACTPVSTCNPFWAICMSCAGLRLEQSIYTYGMARHKRAVTDFPHSSVQSWLSDGMRTGLDLASPSGCSMEITTDIDSFLAEGCCHEHRCQLLPERDTVTCCGRGNVLAWQAAQVWHRLCCKAHGR